MGGYSRLVFCQTHNHLPLLLWGEEPSLRGRVGKSNDDNEAENQGEGAVNDEKVLTSWVSWHYQTGNVEVKRREEENKVYIPPMPECHS